MCCTQLQELQLDTEAQNAMMLSETEKFKVRVSFHPSALNLKRMPPFVSLPA